MPPSVTHWKLWNYRPGRSGMWLHDSRNWGAAVISSVVVDIKSVDQTWVRLECASPPGKQPKKSDRVEKQEFERACGIVEASQWKEAMEDNERENADLRAKLQAMQQESQTKDDELLSLREAQQTDMQQLRDQMSALDVEIQAKEADNQQLRDQMSALDVQLQAKGADNQQLRDEVSALEVEIQAKESDNQQLRDQMSALDVEIQAKGADNQQLRDEVSALDVEIQAKESDNQQLRDQMSALDVEIQAKEADNQQLRDQMSALDVQLQAKGADKQQLRDQMPALDVEIQAEGADNQQLRDQMSALDVQLQAEKSDNQQLRDEVSALKAEIQANAAAMAREESLDLDAQLPEKKSGTPEKNSGTENSRDDNEGFKAQVRCEMEDLQKEATMIRRLFALLVMCFIIFGVCMMLCLPSAAVGSVSYGSERKAAKEYVQAANGMTFTHTTMADSMVSANRIKQEEEERHQQIMREFNEWSELSMKAYETESQIAKLCRRQGSALRPASVCSMFGGTKADTVSDGFPELL